MPNEWKVEGRLLEIGAKAKNKDLTDEEKVAITEDAMHLNQKQRQENKDRLIRLINQTSC